MAAGLVITLVSLAFIAISKLIEMNNLTLRIKKDKDVNNKPNNLDKDYQFIKGLF